MAFWRIRKFCQHLLNKKLPLGYTGSKNPVWSWIKFSSSNLLFPNWFFRNQVQINRGLAWNVEKTYQKYVSILVVSTASWDLDHFSLLEKFPGRANQVHGAPKAFLNFQEFFELFDAFHGVIGMFGCSWYQMKGLWKLIIEKK